MQQRQDKQCRRAVTADRTGTATAVHTALPQSDLKAHSEVTSISKDGADTARKKCVAHLREKHPSAATGASHAWQGPRAALRAHEAHPCRMLAAEPHPTPRSCSSQSDRKY